jgi:dipeptidyl aminopeptidase/acylaminoacyl peptidase
VCSWESRQPPKLVHGVRILALVLMSDDVVDSEGESSNDTQWPGYVAVPTGLTECRAGFQGSDWYSALLQPGLLYWQKDTPSDAWDPKIMLTWLILLSAATAAAGEPQDVVFKSMQDGSEQRYVVVLPEGFKAEESHSVLVALHGHGSDRWQFVKDERDECRAARKTAASNKMIFVSPDYRAKTSWMGSAAEADMLQILEELRKNYRVDKVVISGGSMGGTAALIFAALHPDQVAGVVAMNDTANLIEYDQFQEAIAASFGGSKKEKPDEYRRRSPELHATKLKMPIAVTTGGKDRLVPPESVLRLVTLLRKEKRPILSIHRLDGGHATNFTDAMEAFEFVFSRLNSD